MLSRLRPLRRSAQPSRGRSRTSLEGGSFANGFSYADQWVVITGASSGLGEQFARQLAAQGAHLVLVARRLERLDSLATELRQHHPGISVEVIALDVSTDDAAHQLRSQLTERGIEVTALINNAGFGTAAQLHKAPADRLQQEIDVNVGAVVAFSRAFIDDLRAAPHGFLLNVASLAGFQPNPNQAVYGASKAFVVSFTEALWWESRTVPLRVLALCPGPTKTEFFEIAGGKSAGGGVPMMTADDVVRQGLEYLASRSPGPTLITGGINRAITVAPRVLSRRLLATVSGRAMDAARG